MSNERDYLVIYEEADPYGLPADDGLVFDIEESRQVRPQVDIRQRVDLNLSNTTNKFGLAGFVLAMFGALLGVGTVLAFWVLYPGSVYNAARQLDVSGGARTLIVLGAVSLALMIIGLLMTIYGKRIQAHGNLTSVRIVEKSPHNRVELE